MTDLLVVGAGPTGLTVALQASLMGAEVRIIERNESPRRWSPALAVHPRTMETLRGLGVMEELLARGGPEVELSIHAGKRVIRGDLHDLRLPETEYPLILFVPQPDVEEALRNRLESLGVEVEWETEFAGLSQQGDAVVATVQTPACVTSIECRYLAGCDGSGSPVRRAVGIPFRGRHYRERIVVADVHLDASFAPQTAHAFLSSNGILFLFPLPDANWRLIAPHRLLGGHPDLSAMVSAHTKGMAEVSSVDWARDFHPMHKVAGRYREGRVFLAGDAAHVHSPAGAQGMNTGIQDAANLGWKLACALRGAADELLDSYEAERRAIARGVVMLTGMACALEVSELWPLRVARGVLAGPIASVLLPNKTMTSLFARVVSGLDWRYRRGAVTAEGPGSRAGKRLPDIRLRHGGGRLHDLIDGVGFHLIVYGGLSAASLDALDSRFGSTVETHHLEAGALDEARGQLPGWDLVRPDGYIAASGEVEEIEEVLDYLGRWIGPTPVLERTRGG
jgi:2-polyprenyl-6-methoxyphenol hydroxylase-like FAD-dependent oxidoreductase